MFKLDIAEFVRQIVRQIQSFARSFRQSGWNHNSNADFHGIRNKELVRTAQFLLATATFGIVVFSVILIRSMGFSLPDAPEVSDLSQAGFSFTRTARAAESNLNPSSAVLHLHKGSYWVLQSSKDAATAEAIVEECAKYGLNANYYQVIVNGENYYRVLLSNRYLSNAEAKNDWELLPERFQSGSWVIDIEEAIVVWE